MWGHDEFLSNTNKLMRKIIFILTLTSIAISCSNKQSKVYTITGFAEIISDSIVPVEGKSYTNKYIIVEGSCDDSVRVNFGRGGNYFYFKGTNIKKKIGGDYYGGPNAYFEFDPYKAKSGNLKLEFVIL